MNYFIWWTPMMNFMHLDSVLIQLIQFVSSTCMKFCISVVWRRFFSHHRFNHFRVDNCRCYGFHRITENADKASVKLLNVNIFCPPSISLVFKYIQLSYSICTSDWVTLSVQKLVWFYWLNISRKFWLAIFGTVRWNYFDGTFFHAIFISKIIVE